MKEGPFMKMCFRDPGIGLLLFILLTGSVLAEGLAVPIQGGVLILDGRSLTEIRNLNLGSKETPRLAVHPSSPVMAGLAGDQLVFWNLPAFAEASKHSDTLFPGVSSMEFSADGSSLFLLSPELKAVLVFDLATSKIIGTLPVPGGRPEWMKVTPDGVLVGQKNAVNLLSTSPDKGLLAQYSFPDSIGAAVVTQGRIILARTGMAGFDSYELKTGRAIGYVPAAGVVRDLVVGTGGMYALLNGGEVRALSADSSQTRWTYPSSGATFQQIAAGPNGSSVFCFDNSAGLLVSLDAVAGQENARVNLSGAGAAEPVVVSGI
jgi:outer membrane protein assembly factor BamB